MRYRIIIEFETRLIIAGILYSPSDCRNPTNENASPTKITIGNMIRVRSAAREAVDADSFGAMSVTRVGAKTTPTSAMPVVMASMRFTYD